jgi:hypothetical protein
MSSEYTISFTDASLPGKSPFIIQPSSIDGPGEATTTTPLRLWGRFVVNYGEILTNDLVHLLENFASTAANAPTDTTSGMVWFNSEGGVGGEGSLNVRNTTNTGWIEILSVDAQSGAAGSKFVNAAPGTFTAVVNGNYFVDTSPAGSNSAVTVFLPLTPSVGDVVGIVDVSGFFATNSCFVDGNGELVMSDPSPMEIDINFARTKFCYSGSTYGWRLV